MQTCIFLSNVSSDISEKVVKAVLSNVNSVSSVAVFVAVLPTSLVFLRFLISLFFSYLQMNKGSKRSFMQEVIRFSKRYANNKPQKFMTSDSKMMLTSAKDHI